MLIPIHAFRDRGYLTLLSPSNDGELLVETLRRLGWRVVRGSTRRGGARAALQLARKVREGDVLAFTPDGPRGPARRVQAGALFLAQQTGCPIIPIGASARPRKFLGTWDHYMVPMPFSRAAMVVGEPICVPGALSGAASQRVAHEIGDAINACEKRAEEMVGFPA